MTTDDIIAYCARKHYSLGYAHYWVSHSACEVCGAEAAAPHHIRTRGAGGRDEAGNLLALCTLHHRWIHDAGVETFAARYPKVAKKINSARGLTKAKGVVQ